MAREILNKGVNPNDGSGDSLRIATDKINNNFNELFNAFGNGSVLFSNDIDFGNTRIFYSNTFESRDDLNSISTSAYSGMVVLVQDEGALYYAHGDSWQKLLSNDSENSIPNYTSPLSSLAYSGNWNDVVNKPTIPSSILELNISDGLAGQVLITDGFGNFSFSNGPAISYNDLSDKPALFSGDYDDLSGKPDLSVYQLTADAFDGDYFSLTGRPTIPGDVNELEDSQNLLAGFSGDYDDLINTPTIPTLVSQLTNDLGFLTSETDSQTLTFNNNTGELSVSNGNTVDISNFDYTGFPLNPSELRVNAGQIVRNISGDETMADNAADWLVTQRAVKTYVDNAVASFDSVGNFTLASSTISTDDSSSIIMTPAVTMNSDLTVENNLTVANSLTVDGDIITTSTGTPELFSDNSILLTASTRVTVTQTPFKMASFTTTERNALSAENGDTIYNTTTNKFQGYANGAWVDLH